MVALAIAALTVSGCGSGGPAPTTTKGSAASTAPTASTASTAPSTSTTVTGPPGGPVPAGFRPQSVTFVSATRGWVLGTAPCATAPCTSVVRTTDGGHTWHGIPAPAEELSAYGNPGQPGLVGIRFADGSNGWAWGDKIWATRDGGARWSASASQPAGVVTALEPTGGYVYVLTTAASSSPSATLFRAPVAGGPWTTVETISDAGPSPRLVVHGARLWVLTSGATSNLLRSPDGGSTWVHAASPCPADGISSGLAAGPDGAYVVLGCTSNGGMGSTTKQLFVSTDGGATFRSATGQPPRGGDNTDLAVASSGNVVLASASAASWLYGSFDGGATWTTVLQTNTGGQPWRDLGFTTQTQGVVVEGVAAMADQQSRLWMTTDGGHHWSAVSF